MEWRSGEKWASKIERKKKWHKWFAWYPVVIETIVVKDKVIKVKAWLTMVERKAECASYNVGDVVWDFEYRRIQS